MAFEDDDDDYDGEELLGDDHDDGDEIMDYGFEDPMDKEEENDLKEFEDEFLDADESDEMDDQYVDPRV